MVAGVAGVPFELLTRNPKVKSLKDFGPEDRIAVPTIRASMQAMLMGMALEKEFGPGQHGRLDNNQVQLGHPEAMQALLNPTHEVNSALFDSAVPQHRAQVAAGASGAHLDRRARGPASITNAWSTQKFVDANPIKIKAYIAAIDEASEWSRTTPRGGRDLSRGDQGEDHGRRTIAVIKQPGAIFSATPQRSMLWADYMHRIGLIKQKPASWKDYSFPLIHDRNGS